MSLKQKCVSVDLTLLPQYTSPNLGVVKSFDQNVDVFKFHILDHNKKNLSDDFTAIIVIAYKYECETFMIRDTRPIKNGVVSYTVPMDRIHKGFEGTIMLNLLAEKDDMQVDCGTFTFQKDISLADMVAHEIEVGHDTFLNYNDMIDKAVKEIKQDILEGSFDLQVPPATTDRLGVVQIGEGIDVDKGVISVKPFYETMDIFINEQGHLIIRPK